MRHPEQGANLDKHDNVLVTRLDVTDESSIRSAVEHGLDRFGCIDVLVNNAGFGAYGPLEAISMEQVRREFDTNVIGLLATTKAVLPHMRKAKSGIILNMNSMGGKLTFPLVSLYCGSKFAVEGLSEVLQFELKPIGVRIKIIEPDVIRTDFAGRSLVFANDEHLTGYQPLVKSVQAARARTAAAPTVFGPFRRRRRRLGGSKRWNPNLALSGRTVCRRKHRGQGA